MMAILLAGIGGALEECRAGVTAAGGTQVECETSLEEQMDTLLLQQHDAYCASRLSLVRRAGRLPLRVAFPQLQDKNVQTTFPVEKAWREELVAAGYVQSPSVLSSTFILSKQQRHALLPFGGVCGETQLFNHIPGQRAWVDKINVTRALRAAGLASLQPLTLLFGDQSTSELAELRDLDGELARWAEIPGGESADAVGWIHKRRGVENGHGITLLSWRELQARRAADADGSALIRWLRPGVLQRYVESPLLLDGRKIDLRCFILLASVNPLAAFFHSEVSARCPLVNSSRLVLALP